MYTPNQRLDIELAKRIPEEDLSSVLDRLEEAEDMISASLARELLGELAQAASLARNAIYAIEEVRKTAPLTELARTYANIAIDRTGEAEAIVKHAVAAIQKELSDD